MSCFFAFLVFLVDSPPWRICDVRSVGLLLTRADLAKDLIKDVMEEEMVETEMIGPPRPPPVEEEELIEGAGEVLELSEEVFEAMEEKQSERTTETIVATVPPRFQSKDSKASVLLRRHGDSVKKRSIPIALQDDPNDRKKQKKS